MAKILLAEDEPDIRELLTYTLKFGGHDVHPRKNGQEVVDSVKEVKPDLIMLDVRMPRMTGYEACRALKANPETDHIPVVFLSAKGQEQEVATGLEAGAVAYLLKPFDPAALLLKLGDIIAEHVDGPKAAGGTKPLDGKDKGKKDA